MSNENFHIQATIHIIKRCVQLLKRENGTDDTKQEYHYWIQWLKNKFKNFHKIDEINKKKVLKTLNGVDKLLIEDIGKFKK